MASGSTVSQLVRKHVDGESNQTTDHLIVEEPLEIRLDGHQVATTMRTPGDDHELAVGYCHTEGLLAGAGVQSVSEAAVNVVNVDTGGQAPESATRLTTTTSSCGWCGTDGIDEVTARILPLVNPVAFDVAVLAGVPERVRRSQKLFDATGGVHAAAAFDLDGEVIAVREDIGRHNAVDKVVGRLLLDGRLPVPELALYVSGRTSFEIIQKAWAAGFSAVVAVSAPSSLAAEAARRAGMTLAGFARPGRLNIYVEGAGQPR